MLISTVFIIATQLINACFSTRLPLEVYELTPSNSNSNSPAGVTATDIKHSNLEYSAINSAAAATSLTDSTTYLKQHASLSINDSHNPPEQVDLEILTSQDHTQTQLANQLDRRRSRQMLDLLKTHRDLTGNYNKLHHGFQMQLPTSTTKTTSGNNDDNVATSNVAHDNGKDVRILYQVGDSEDGLPICAPNAVCSKIDLYEIPWIERQCRCPSINRAPEIIIHHHHKNPHLHNNHNSEKYYSYYEHSKIMHQNKHVLLDAAAFGADRKYDNLHLKKLMHKLGAVYEDDINLPSDYVLHDENSALASSDEGGALLYGEDINDNEFPHLAMKRQQQHLFTNSAHMRHSGHMGGHQEKLTYIGGCPSGLGIEDGHTIADKTRHYKMCQPVHRLPVCRHFRDFTWTLTTSAEMNSTEQIVHCRCPKNSVTYLTKREPLEDGKSSGYKYLFACSPLTRLRCQRKQPCKLFTVRKRQEFIDEVNLNALCQCPKGHHCPSHHTQSGVIAGETFLEDNIQTYSGYCMAND